MGELVRKTTGENYRSGKYCELSSFSEEKISPEDKNIIAYNHYQLSRVYPRFHRVNSSNYDPVSKWIMGCQLVALNYQTPDKGMQLNQAKFMQNGRCGYILKPSFMNNAHYNPNQLSSLSGSVEKVVLTVRLLGGRNLFGRDMNMGVVQPFIALEVIGLQQDNQNQRTPPRKDHNTLNPIWKDQTFVFPIACPDLAFLRFEVGNEVNAGSYISQATIPMRSLRQGYRCVQMKNYYSEDIPMSMLLVQICITNPKEEQEKTWGLMVEETRRLAEMEKSANKDPSKLKILQDAEARLLEKLEHSRLDGHRTTHCTTSTRPW